MTEFDPSSTADDTAKRAFVAFCACALVWIICAGRAPFDLYARLRDRRGAEGDGLRDEAGADWGGEHLHNGTGQ